MRSTLLLSRKLIPPFLVRIQRKKNIIERKLERALKSITFLNDKLSDQQRLSIIKSFKRFTILRHPLERLLSAYLDKLHDPISKDDINSYNYFNRLKVNIYHTFHKEEYQKWNESGHNNGDTIGVSFPTFLHWLISQDYITLNEHFMPQYYNCEPCRMDYHFYGNFENFREDGNKILEQFRPNLTLAQDGYHWRGKSTAQLLNSYYDQVPDWLKRAVYLNLSQEIDFYHHVFPHHKHITNQILVISNN